MPQTDTVEKILDAASALFAERGYTETSLRTITSTANVNLAAVNYHFGSKKALIQAVFSRFLTPFTQQLESNLDLLEVNCEGDFPSVDELTEVIFLTLNESMRGKVGSPVQFMRLLGLAYTQSQEHLRHFIISEYGDHYARYSSLLRQAMPNLTPIDFYWRLYFMLGASVFTLSSFESINNILTTDFDVNSRLEDTIGLLVPAVTAMLNRPMTT